MSRSSTEFTHQMRVYIEALKRTVKLIKIYVVSLSLRSLAITQVRLYTEGVKMSVNQMYV